MDPAAGEDDAMALCADGTLAAWGYNASGQLGIGSLANIGAPTAVQQASGILVGKTITSIGAGDAHSLAVCSDGTMATWGRNVESQLGTGNTAQSTSPVAVLTTTLAAGERFTRANSSSKKDRIESAEQKLEVRVLPFPHLHHFSLSSLSVESKFNGIGSKARSEIGEKNEEAPRTRRRA